MLAALVLLALSADVRILAVPMPLEVVAERLADKKPKLGLWQIAISNQGDKPLPMSREELVIAIAAWCRENGAPVPLFLQKEMVGPIVTRRRGGKLQAVQRFANYGAAGAAIGANPWAALAIPIMDLVGKSAEARIPDISALTLEIPASFVVPAGGGVTLTAWSARMSQRPVVIGPIRIAAQTAP